MVTEKLVFVAFGDSLTVGYHSPTRENESPRFSPYTTFLKQKAGKALEQKGAGGLQVQFLNLGIVGEVTGDMIERFDRDVVESQPDFVIILGGSNDLGWGFEPPSVVRNLAWMYDEALAREIQPVACTIPSVLGFDEGIEPRLQLNQLIKEASAERGLNCVDLFSVTCDSSTRRLKEKYSNDGLHLTPLGYEVVAEAVFSGVVRPAILERLENTKSASNREPSTGRSATSGSSKSR